MFGFGILSVLIFLPLVGVAFILTQRGDDAASLRNIRWAALWTTIVVFGLSLVAWGRFDIGNPGFQLVEQKAWLGQGLSYKLGVDGMSLPFVILTTFLMPFCIGASWESITVRVREYMIAFLVLESLMIGVFCALDLVLFYLFFEGGLIPMFLIIGVWGRQAPHLRVVQVLPVHATWLAADARRHSRDVLDRTYDGYRRAPEV